MTAQNGAQTSPMNASATGSPNASGGVTDRNSAFASMRTWARSSQKAIAATASPSIVLATIRRISADGRRQGVRTHRVLTGAPSLANVWSRIARDGSLLFGLLFAAGELAGRIPEPGDLAIYWGTRLHYPTLYVPATGNGTTTPYPPPFLVAFEALHALPWEVILVGWQVATFAALWYVARGWTPALIVAGLLSASYPVLGFVGGPFQVAALGNVQLLMVAAIVAGLRHPAAWSVVLLTKMTPGIGLAWFALRREWRPLGIALGVTAGIVLVSFIAWPAGWPEYAGFALRNVGGSSGGFLPRVALAAILLVVGAWRGWSWTVPVASTLAVLVFYPAWFLLGLLAASRSCASRSSRGRVTCGRCPRCLSASREPWPGGSPRCSSRCPRLRSRGARCRRRRAGSGRPPGRFRSPSRST